MPLRPQAGRHVAARFQHPQATRRAACGLLHASRACAQRAAGERERAFYLLPCGRGSYRGLSCSVFSPPARRLRPKGIFRVRRARKPGHHENILDFRSVFLGTGDAHLRVGLRRSEGRAVAPMSSRDRLLKERKAFVADALLGEHPLNASDCERSIRHDGRFAFQELAIHLQHNTSILVLITGTRGFCVRIPL